MTHRRTKAPRWTVIALATLVPATVLGGSVGLAMADDSPGASGQLPTAAAVPATGRGQNASDSEREDGEDGEREDSEQSPAARRQVRTVVTSGAGTAELDSLLRDIERLHRQVRVLRLQVAALERAAGATASSGPQATPSQTADPGPATSPPPLPRPTATLPTATLPTATLPTATPPTATPPATTPTPTVTRAPATHTTTGASS